MRGLLKLTGTGLSGRRRILSPQKYLLGTAEAIVHNPFGQGSFDQRFSKNTSPPIATRLAFTEAAKKSDIRL
jgi:hypothetical protein